MVETKNELQVFADSASSMAALDAVLKKDVENGNLGSSGKAPILKLNQDDGNCTQDLKPCISTITNTLSSGQTAPGTVLFRG